MTDEQILALNRKLAVWAGYVHSPLDCKCPMCSRTQWIAPNAESLGDLKDHCELPLFTESLDLCFERLIPKLKGLGYMARVQYSPLRDNDTGKQISDWTGYASTFYVVMDGKLHANQTWAIEKTPALALCRAIERLIGDIENLKTLGTRSEK